MVSIKQASKRNLGFSVVLGFIIGIHKKDLALLESIKAFFDNIGIISKNGECFNYTVTKINDIAKIIEHFDKYPLITQKLADYLLFKQAFNLMCQKLHLTEEGLQKLVAIKASINLGLSTKLKESFPNVIPVKRPLIKDKKIQDPY
jgi:hypothetical protein